MSPAHRPPRAAYVTLSIATLGLFLAANPLSGPRPTLSSALTASFASPPPPDAHRLPVTCAEVIAVDRDKYARQAALSRNYPPTSCRRLVLRRSSAAKTWRRATWAKVDVLHEHAAALAAYDFVVVRDIDTKVNVSFLLEQLPKTGGKQFIIGFIQNRPGARCEAITAVTNWFAYWNGHGLVRAWRRSRRGHTDQHIFNEKFAPCCRDDVLCVDKCASGLNEVHCRRPQALNAGVHYGSQNDCVVNETRPNPLFYHPGGKYRCEDGNGYRGDL